VFEEADECAGWLEYLRDAGIRHDPTLLEESFALASIFAKSVKTARENTERMKKDRNRKGIERARKGGRWTK
jgi:hypothetical protein